MPANTCRRCGATTTTPVPLAACPNCRTEFANPTATESASTFALQAASPPPLYSGTAPHRGAPHRESLRTDRRDRSTMLMILGGGLMAVLFAVGIPLLFVGLARDGDTLPENEAAADLDSDATLIGQLVGRPTANRPVLGRAELAESVDPSVVLIHTEGDDGEGCGSGFIVDDHGTVVTNRHVIEDSDRVVVVFNDESIAASTKVIYVDPDHDFALVRVSSAKRLPRPLPLAAALPKKGEDIAAFGSPGGLMFSTSFGNVSALREMDAWHVVQFTAPISPGNSGGPVVNMRGEVVGITTFQIDFERSQNLNFALSAVNIAETIGRLRASGRLK